jgi:hypothetical protein
MTMKRGKKGPGRFDPLIAEAERLIAQVDALPPPQIAWRSRAPDDRSRARAPGDAWVLAIAPWLVDDGQHGALYPGRSLDFGVFVEQMDLAPAAAGPPCVRRLADDVYEVRAQVVARRDDDCVLDFGLLAYAWHCPEWMQPGAWVEGDVALHLDAGTCTDPGCYRDGGFPAMLYPWRISRIVLETTPRIPAAEADRERWGNPAMQTNHPRVRRFRDVTHSDPRRDWPKGEMARYYLHCRLLSRIPRMPDERDRHPRHGEPTDA